MKVTWTHNGQKYSGNLPDGISHEEARARIKAKMDLFDAEKEPSVEKRQWAITEAPTETTGEKLKDLLRKQYSPAGTAKRMFPVFGLSEALRYLQIPAGVVEALSEKISDMPEEQQTGVINKIIDIARGKDTASTQKILENITGVKYEPSIGRELLTSVLDPMTYVGASAIKPVTKLAQQTMKGARYLKDVVKPQAALERRAVELLSTSKPSIIDDIINARASMKLSEGEALKLGEESLANLMSRRKQAVSDTFSKGRVIPTGFRTETMTAGDEALAKEITLVESKIKAITGSDDVEKALANFERYGVEKQEELKRLLEYRKNLESSKIKSLQLKEEGKLMPASTASQLSSKYGIPITPRETTQTGFVIDDLKASRTSSAQLQEDIARLKQHGLSIDQGEELALEDYISKLEGKKATINQLKEYLSNLRKGLIPAQTDTIKVVGKGATGFEAQGLKAGTPELEQDITKTVDYINGIRNNPTKLAEFKNIGQYKELADQTDDVFSPFVKTENIDRFIDNNVIKFKDRAMKDKQGLGQKVIKQTGENGLNMVARGLAQANDHRDIAGRLIMPIEKEVFNFLKVKNKALLKDEFEKIALYMDGSIGAGELPMDETVNRLANATKSSVDQIGKLAQKVGLKIRTQTGDLVDFNIIKKYFPRLMDDEAYSLLKKIQAMPDDEALKALSGNREVFNFIRRPTKVYKTPAEHARNLKMTMKEASEKFGLDFRTDIGVITQYLDGMAQSISKKMYWGDDFSKLKTDLDKIYFNFGGDSPQYKNAKKLFEGTTGMELSKFNDIVGRQARSEPLETIRALNVLNFSLPSRMIQTAQRGNIASQSLKGFGKSMTQEGQLLATEVGTTLRSTLHNFDNLAGINQKADNWIINFSNKYLNALGITAEDARARKTAANVADYLIDKTFATLKKNPDNRSARQFLESYGVGIDIKKALARGGFTKYEKANMIRMYDKEANFWMLASDLPSWMQGKYKRAIYQFYPSAYLQGMFIKRQLIKAAKTGNVLPLVKYALAQQISGEIHGDIKDIVAGRFKFWETTPYRKGFDEEGWKERIGGNWFRQGLGLGLATNFLEKAEYADDPIDAIAGLVLGVNYNTGKRGYETLKQAGMATKAIGTDKFGKELKRTAVEATGLPIVPGIAKAPLRNVLRTKKEQKEIDKYVAKKNKEQSLKSWYKKAKKVF